MRIIGAAVVLAACRAAALAGHAISWSAWSPVAYGWHDAAIVLLVAVLDAAARRTPRLAWTLYAVFVGYLALNLPLLRVMSTPMTWRMWSGAGGALSDSMWLYATTGNLLWVACVLACAIAVPLALERVRHVRRRATFAVLLGIVAAVVAAGPTAASRVDTRGLERNAWSALVVSALPRVVRAEAANADFRAPRFDREPAAYGGTLEETLTRFRGIAAGRNVVLVSLESTAAQYLGLYGADQDVMPNLSALADSAIVFDNAYAVYPESIKGLLSILCSTYPAVDRAAETVATVPCRSIAATLSSRGYRTGLFHSGRFAYLGMDAVIRHRGFDLLADAGDIGGQHESSFGVDDRSTAARLLEWIDAAPPATPFFATYLPIAGHHPYEVPESTSSATAGEFGRYRNALRYADDVLGTLIRGIRARGLEAKTLWIVLGDHGEAFGQHDGNFGHTFQLYEENVRVPFLLAAPGAIPHRLRSAHVVSLVDTAPTLADLLGLAPSPLYQGDSALNPAPRMALFFADYSLGLLGLRDGRFKYIHDLDSGRSRLFDLSTDPLETHDLAAGRGEDVRWYARRLRQWSATQQARVDAQ